MQTIHCEIHNLSIKIYNYGEENLFVDDDKREVAIFTKEDGTKYLKRYVINECDENCSTIKNLLGIE